MSTRLLAALRSQRFGVLCGLAAAALLALGTVVMDVARGLYAGFRFDDLRPFFTAPRLEHLWFYGLSLALALWSLSALVCTWDSVATRVRQRVRRPSAYGAPIFHVAFVLALVAHLWNGLAEETHAHAVGPRWTEVAGEQLRLVDVAVDAAPSGMPRAVTVTLARAAEVPRDATAPVSEEPVVLGYNAPYVRGAGARALLLGEARERAVAVLRVGDERARVLPGERLGSVALTRVFEGRSLRAPVVEVWLDGEPEPRWLPLTPDAPPSAPVAFVGVEVEPVVTLTERVNPAAPLVGVVAALAVLATALVVAEHRWRQRRRTRAGRAAHDDPGDEPDPR